MRVYKQNAERERGEKSAIFYNTNINKPEKGKEGIETVGEECGNERGKGGKSDIFEYQ